MTLADSPLYRTARIRDLGGDETLVARLREVGFIRGEEVRVCGRAPFGDPLIVELRGAIIALRVREAACVKL